MIDRDLVETYIALALILACAATAVATTRVPRSERAPRARREHRRLRARTGHVPGTGSQNSVIETSAAGIPPALAGRPRPRILTGEPAAPEQHRPAGRRAIALIGGITALAAGGAVGLLVVVRTLVAMFKKIGG
jgi:hypothetical protein